ncbi:MAG: TonB-dependent receptor [Mariniphaga sp.]
MNKIYDLLCHSQQRWEKTIRIMKLTAGLIIFVMISVSAADLKGMLETSQQQGRKISGKVSDQTGATLPGVSVVVKGTTVGTITDNNGAFSLALPATGAKTLTFSFVGMVTQDVAIDAQSVYNVKLAEETIGIQEVVAIGYGTALKKDLTGSVAAVSAKRLMDKPAFNVGTALQGKIAGVQIVDQGGGSPGIAPLIRIRGTNSLNTSNDPLFVVDGIVGVANALMTLNPNDIESIDVLKDASATAIYGARGANGVVLITTKRGVSGKTQVELTTFMTSNSMQRHFYTLNADQMMYVYEQAMANGNKYTVAGKTIDRSKDFRGATGTGSTYDTMPWLFKKVTAGAYVMPLIGKDGNSYAPIYNSDWESQAYGPSISNGQQISIRGGNENAKFSLSVGKSRDNGLMKGSYNNRYSGKLDGDIKITPWLDMSTEIMITKSKRTTRDVDNITRNTAEVWAILPVRYPADPALGVYASRWASNADFNVGEQWYTPNYKFDQEHGFQLNDQATGNIVFNAKITKDLSFKSNFAVDINNLKNDTYNGKQFNAIGGSATIDATKAVYWQNEDYFNYAKKIGTDHSINAMVGISWSEYRNEYFSANNSNFFDNFYQFSNLGVGAATRPSVGSSDVRSALNSYFARGNYNYKGKYLLTLTARYDGSSKFGSNSKYGLFPSAGFGWRASDEDFIKNIDLISNLKFRASWGKTGNQEVGSYVSQTYLGTSTVYLGGVANTGLVPTSVGNDNLKWETNTQSDIGVELGILKGVINLDVDYYQKETSDMLLSVLLPLSTTTGSITKNFGSVENKGWEFTLNTNNVRGKDFSWTTNVNLTMNRNKITKLGPTGADVIRNSGAGNGTSIWRVGQPIGSFFGLVRQGVWGTNEAAAAARYGMLPGDLKYQDTNHDGIINLASDGVIIGQAFPKYTVGFNNTFHYKKWDASLDIRIVQGVQKANVNESAEDRQLVSGGKNTIIDAWRPDYQTAMIAQVRPGNGGAYYQSYPDTHMIEDGSFIRGDGLTFGYSFAEATLAKIGLSKLRLYVNAKNFFVITGVKGYDPEGSSPDKLDGVVPNVDKYQYPRPTVYSFGVNIGL